MMLGVAVSPQWLPGLLSTSVPQLAGLLPHFLHLLNGSDYPQWLGQNAAPPLTILALVLQDQKPPNCI